MLKFIVFANYGSEGWSPVCQADTWDEIVELREAFLRYQGYETILAQNINVVELLKASPPEMFVQPKEIER